MTKESGERLPGSRRFFCFAACIAHDPVLLKRSINYNKYNIKCLILSIKKRGSPMKSGIVLAALVALGSTASAHAGVQTYEFTAVLNQVGSYKELTWSDRGEGLVAGTTVKAGDLIKGKVSFDEDLNYINWNPSIPKDPRSGEAGEFYYARKNPSQPLWINYTFVGIGQTYVSEAESANVSVTNDVDDMLYISTNYGWGATRQSAGLGFTDFGGALYSNGLIPQSIDLADFDRSRLFASWNRGSDGGLIMIHADLTSLTRIDTAAVPEPGSMGLLMLGCAAAGLAVRRGRKAGTAAKA